ncbi:hypothetical protein BpHYR1_038710 [Brachionus plicatilis]|uniref:Uncharacterized protein n=1 Tax=Brachionus plicatilis TaxID=10195 RepID=A0A3M7S9W3_BRAPC|nr:hypothetical protein BpHYR1_038710 [Brachionus plicatilis]
MMASKLTYLKMLLDLIYLTNSQLFLRLLEFSFFNDYEILPKIVSQFQSFRNNFTKNYPATSGEVDSTLTAWQNT